jgi:hypothetical protein
MFFTVHFVAASGVPVISEVPVYVKAVAAVVVSMYPDCPPGVMPR